MFSLEGLSLAVNTRSVSWVRTADMGIVERKQGNGERMCRKKIKKSNQTTRS